MIGGVGGGGLIIAGILREGKGTSLWEHEASAEMVEVND
tara:strand:- start:388 stop:504 length:117 start_codon:yes stop_codon:yes gene_type:complete